MPIDTEIDGDPRAVRSAADWLRWGLAKRTSQTVERILSAKATADGRWQGDAADAFKTRMAGGATKAEGLAEAATRCAQEFDDFATELERAQSEMQAVRENAAKAGLTVDGFVINDPSEPEQYQAYATALNAAAAAQHIEKIASDTLKNVWSDISSKWFFVVGDLINGAAGTLIAAHSSTLMKHSKFLAEESEKFLNLAKAAPPGSTAATVYRDFDTSRALTSSADDAAKAAASAESTAGRLGLKIGGALAVGGIAYDIANGKDVDQAIVAGGVGFGASVLAGAAIGTAIPVPVVGTAVGALGGAVVGIFASGAVDSLYENGVGAVGAAINDGASAVADAGKAVGGLAEDVWDAIF